MVQITSFFVQELVLMWTFSIKKIESIAFFVLKILMFIVLTRLTTAIFFGFLHEVLRNDATDLPK